MTQRQWRLNDKGMMVSDEPAQTVGVETSNHTDTHPIRMDSPDLLNAPQQNEADKAAEYNKSLLFKQQRIEKEKFEKEARLAQERLDELNADPEVTQGRLSRRLTPRKDGQEGMLLPLTKEESQQIKLLKRNHDQAVAKQHEELVKNQHKQQRYGDDAKKLELLRLFSTMTKDEKQGIISALRGLPVELSTEKESG